MSARKQPSDAHALHVLYRVAPDLDVIPSVYARALYPDTVFRKRPNGPSTAGMVGGRRLRTLERRGLIKVRPAPFTGYRYAFTDTGFALLQSGNQLELGL